MSVFILLPLLFLPIIILTVVILCCTRRNDDGLPKNLPVLGMLPYLLLNLHNIYDYTTNILARSGGTFRVKVAGAETILSCDPATIHHILNTKFSSYEKGPEFREIFHFLGDGIITSHGDSWKAQRATAVSLMNTSVFHRSLVGTILSKIRTGIFPVLEQAAISDTVLDLQDMLQRFSYDFMCILATGYDPGSLSVDLPKVPRVEDGEEAVFYRHVLPRSVWKLQKWLRVGLERRYELVSKAEDAKVADTIRRKREELDVQQDGPVTENDPPTSSTDLLSSYIRMEKDEIWSEHKSVVRDTVVNFIFAGKDTTSSALSWLFWLLSKNPHCEAAIIAELRSKVTPLESTGPPPTTTQKLVTFHEEDVNSLVYLHGAICEALRLYPPVPFEHRCPLSVDILPNGHRVSPETKVLFSFYGMARMESVWGDDCLEFKPERWVSSNGTMKHEPTYKFAAFSSGRRTCLGKKVALLQMKLAAAAIIFNYKLTVVDERSVVPAISMVLRMKNGLKVTMRRRVHA